ncbi:MAG: hypothetical protein ACRECT_06515 [Thermoplasmata archaeon]
MPSPDPEVAVSFWGEPRLQWLGLSASLVGVLVVVGLTAYFLRPITTGGLVAVILAAVFLPILAVWAGRISTQMVVAEVRQSAKERSQLLGLGLAELRREYRESTSEQTVALLAALEQAAARASENTDRIVKGLEGTMAAIQSLSSEVAKTREAELQAEAASRLAAEQVRASFEKLRQTQIAQEERAKPSVHAQTVVRSAWLFWRHNWLLLGNVGGRAQTVVLNYRYHQQMNPIRIEPAFSLSPQETWEYDLGDIRQAAGSSVLLLVVETRDETNHVYSTGEVTVPLESNQWTELPLKLQR